MAQHKLNDFDLARYCFPINVKKIYEYQDFAVTQGYIPEKPLRSEEATREQIDALYKDFREHVEPNFRRFYPKIGEIELFLIAHFQKPNYAFAPPAGWKTLFGYPAPIYAAQDFIKRLSDIFAESRALARFFRRFPVPADVPIWYHIDAGQHEEVLADLCVPSPLADAMGYALLREEPTGGPLHAAIERARNIVESGGFPEFERYTWPPEGETLDDFETAYNH